MTTARDARTLGDERPVEAKIYRFVMAVLPVIAMLGLLIMLIGPSVLVPAEDATILFQYSDNWATTGQITYYSGGAPVEGATDFLWMAILAALRYVHVPPFWAASILNIVAAFAIAFLSLRLAGVRSTWKSVLVILGLVMLAPQLGGALAGFSVLPFAALILVCAYLFQTRHDAGLAVACLALCLFRPDGVVFAFPLVALRLFAEKTGWTKRVGIYLLLFALPGILYFVWRWRYFGEFLPLPFLVKSDARRVLGIALGTSNVDILKYLVFDGIFLGVLFGSKLKERTNFRLLLALGIVPTLFYLTMRLDQDIADRFFAYLLVCAAVLVAVNWPHLAAKRVRIVSGVAVLWLVLLSLTWAAALSRYISDGYHNTVVAISKDLHDVSPSGVLALSEAGRVAYFSRWPTIDLWGLNTPEFAHHLFSPSDVSATSPDVLVMYYPEAHHDCRVKPGWETPYKVRTWPDLARNVITGIDQTHNYDLWMVPSSGLLRKMLHGNRPGEGEYQCWFVKKTFAGHDQVTTILAKHRALTAAEFFHIRFGTPLTP